MANPLSNAFQDTTSCDGILLNTLQALFHSPMFGINVNKATPNKDIWLKVTFYILFMSEPALCKCQYTGTGIQDPNKTDRDLTEHFPVAFVE